MDFFENALISSVNLATKIYTKQTEGIYYQPRATHGFVFYLSGKCHYVYKSGVSFVAEKDMFLYLPKGEIYEIHPECDCSCILINIDTANNIEFSAFGQSTICSQKLRDRFLRAVNIMHKKNKGYKSELISEAYKIVSLIQGEQHTEYLPQSTVRKIEPAISCICDKYCDPNITVSQLAALCDMSVRYFGRLFCAYYGVYPKQYIINLRIELARSLLSSSNESVAQIADTCGFQNPYYFSRIFHRNTGMSPTEYRKISIR